MLSRRLVVHRQRNQPCNFGQRGSLLPSSGRRRIRRDVLRGGGSYRAARGISTGNECREQRKNKNSFAMCVFHTSSSASGAVGEARTLFARGGAIVIREPPMR